MGGGGGEDFIGTKVLEKGGGGYLISKDSMKTMKTRMDLL